MSGETPRNSPEVPEIEKPVDAISALEPIDPKQQLPPKGKGKGKGKKAKAEEGGKEHRENANKQDAKQCPKGKAKAKAKAKSKSKGSKPKEASSPRGKDQEEPQANNKTRKRRAKKEVEAEEKVEKGPEEVEVDAATLRKKRLSRKSSAYHCALKKAKADGKSDEDAKVIAKAVPWRSH